MIREHPRFQKTAIIFISAIHLTDVDRLRGYEMGAVDYVPVPVVPEVLRAKVRVFAELYRKTRAARAAQRRARAARRRAHRRARGLERAAARERAAPQPRARRRPDGLVGLGPRRPGLRCGTTGQYRIFGVEPAPFDADARQRPHADPSGAISRAFAAIDAKRRRRGRHLPDRVPDRRPTARCAGASAPRRRSSTRRARCVRVSGVDHRHHRAQGGRGAPDAAGARGRSSRHATRSRWCSRSCG